jgi:hypothetical protein
MRLGIMQPYFFPNLGHFALIAATDEWVVFDVTQYARKSWINRNRILHPTEGWQYVSVPLATSSTQIKIHEARVADSAGFHQSLCGKLSHYRKRAPHFDAVLDIVNQAFESAADDSLTTLNVSALTAVCNYLDIPFRHRLCSDLGLNFPEYMGPGDWAPFIARALGATGYINPIGGSELFRSADFTDHGIDLWFARFGDFNYPTPGYNFVPGLSILDVLMWNPPEQVRESALALLEILRIDQLDGNYGH